jgi:sugar O-acyltransferase (sialic acid O-acetyltransferase NeuD family)
LRPLFVARDREESGRADGDEEVILEDELGRYPDLRLAIGIGEPGARKRVWFRYRATHKFQNLVHPSATFGKGQYDAIRGDSGAIVCAGVRLTNNIQLGVGVVVNLNATIGHDCIVEDFVNIAPGVNVSGNVKLSSGCSVGTGAAIIQGASNRSLVIWENVVIGAGAVVLADCLPDSVYAGVPARRIK